MNTIGPSGRILNRNGLYGKIPCKGFSLENPSYSLPHVGQYAAADPQATVLVLSLALKGCERDPNVNEVLKNMFTFNLCSEAPTYLLDGVTHDAQ